MRCWLLKHPRSQVFLGNLTGAKGDFFTIFCLSLGDDLLFQPYRESEDSGNFTIMVE